METLYRCMQNFTVPHQISNKTAHTAICVTECWRFLSSSAGTQLKWTRSCLHNSLIYQNCFLLLRIPPHAAFQTPLEWPNNPQRPHQNINTTEPQIPYEKAIQTHQYTINTLISLCITAQKTELCCIATCNGDLHHSYQNQHVFMWFCNTVILWYIITISNNYFIPVIKAEFSASLLQSSVSHDPSEIILIYWFAAQKTFLIIINVENSCAASFYASKQQHLFEK